MEASTGEIVDFSKLKVPELKKELKQRGLSVTGNKIELLERLQKASKDKVEDLTSAGSVDDLEEDLLNEDDDDHLDEGVLSELETSPVTEVPSKNLKRLASEDDSAAASEKQPSKKIVLNRKASSTEEPEQNGSEAKTETKSEERKIIKLSELTEKERLELRAKKFGLPISDNTKKVVRAERFGTQNSKGSTPIQAADAAPMNVLLERGKRFGVSVSNALVKLDQESKLEKRKQRFGTSLGAEADGQKAQLRLERFKVKEPVKLA